MAVPMSSWAGAGSDPEGVADSGAASLRTAAGVLAGLRLISLSHVNDPATTSLFPGDPAFTLETVATVENDGYFMQYVRESEATGTHWGAPGHFNAGELLADQLDPNDMLLPAVKIDIRHQCLRDADYAVTVDDLRAWERQHGRIPDESAVVLWTGWESRWGTPAFPNMDSDGVLHQPGFSVPAVEWLIRTGRLGNRGATGIDTFGPDLGIDGTYAASKLIYQRHRLSFEILANLAHLRTTGAWILAGGQINKNGSGSTAQVFGLIPSGVHT